MLVVCQTTYCNNKEYNSIEIKAEEEQAVENTLIIAKNYWAKRGRLTVIVVIATQMNSNTNKL